MATHLNRSRVCATCRTVRLPEPQRSLARGPLSIVRATRLVLQVERHVLQRVTQILRLALLEDE